jgi:4-amino-4-deoxy-L-arabinose transferase-like glycosyltransferase
MKTKKKIFSPYSILILSVLILTTLFSHFLFNAQTYTNLLIFSTSIFILSCISIFLVERKKVDRVKVRNILIGLLLIFYLYFSLDNYINVEFLNTHTKELVIVLLATIAILLTISKDSKVKVYKPKKIVVITILVLTILLGAGLRLKDAKNLSFTNDEYQVVSAAAGYRYTGTFMYWNFLVDTPDSIQSCPELDDSCHYYTRAYPHSMLIALSFHLFGISELSARIPSLIFGILLIPLSFFFAKYMTKRDDVSLMYTFIIAMHGAFINLSKYARMYALVIPITVLSLFFLYKGLFEKPRKEIPNKFLNNYFSYRYIELIVGTLLLYIAYLLHINVVVIAPVLFIFIIYKYFSSKEKKYIPIILLGFLFLIITLLNFHTSLSIPILNSIFNFISPFERYNPEYLQYMVGYPLRVTISIPLILSALFWINKLKIEKQKDNFIFLLICTITVIITFIFIADRYASIVYVSMLMPFSFLLVTWAFFLINEKILPSIKKKNLLVMFFLLLLVFLTNIYGRITASESTPPIDYKRAYSIINENIDPEKDIILGQYLRNYYLDPERINQEIMYSLGKNQQQTFEEFLEIVNNAESGYIVWADNKKWHIRPEIRQYCCDNFEQLSGESCSEPVNDYRIEIFYFSND